MTKQIISDHQAYAILRSQRWATTLINFKKLSSDINSMVIKSIELEKDCEFNFSISAISSNTSTNVNGSTIYMKVEQKYECTLHFFHDSDISFDILLKPGAGTLSIGLNPTKEMSDKLIVKRSNSSSMFEDYLKNCGYQIHSLLNRSDIETALASMVLESYESFKLESKKKALLENMYLSSKSNIIQNIIREAA